MENLLTVNQAAAKLQLSVLTVRRQLARGALRGIKRGRVWRVPETALLEHSPAPTAKAPEVAAFPTDAPENSPEDRAAAILAEMDSGDTRRKNVALLAYAQADAATSAIIEAAAAQALADWEATHGQEETA